MQIFGCESGYFDVLSSQEIPVLQFLLIHIHILELQIQRWIFFLDDIDQTLISPHLDKLNIHVYLFIIGFTRENGVFVNSWSGCGCGYGVRLLLFFYRFVVEPVCHFLKLHI